MAVETLMTCATGSCDLDVAESYISKFDEAGQAVGTPDQNDGPGFA
jgi:hypothetical protein